MSVTYPDISLPINMARFHIPAAEAAFSYADEIGLHLDTGGDVKYALASVPVAQGLAPALVGAIEYLKPQTLTLTYATMHLVAGMTVNLNYNFASVDGTYNDFALAVLEDSSGTAQPALLYDAKRYAQDLKGLQGFDKLNALFQGHHGGEHFAVDHTGDYTLVVGIADASDKTGTSEIALTDVSIGLPSSVYTVVPGLGLSLSDGTLLVLNGIELPPAASGFKDAATPLLAPAGQEVVTALAVEALTIAIGQIALNAAVGAGGVLASNAGGTINLRAGGQATQTVLTNYPGVGLVAINSSGLLAPNGAGLLSAADASLISQDGAGIVSHDGGGIVSHDSGGIVSHDSGGVISHDGGSVVSNDGGSFAGTGATGLYTLNGTGIAGDQASFEGAGADVATAAAFDTAPVSRSYTLTGDPGFAPAKPPVVGTEAVLSPAATANVSDRTPAVAGLSNGKYVSVWSDNFAFTDGSGIVFNSGNPEIRGQVFNADGTPSGAVLTVTPAGNGDNSSTQPSVTGLAGGRFVVTWTGNDLPNGRNTQIKAQFYNADGTASGSTLTVNPALTGSNGAVTQLVQSQSTVASLFNGGAIVAYRVANRSGFTVLQGQRYAADGTAAGGPISIGGQAGFSVDDQNLAAAGLQDGGFVVAYAEPDAFRTVGGVTTQTNGIYVQRFTSSGVSTGAPVQVNTALAQKTGGLDSPAVAVLQDGSFVVTYRSEPSTATGLSTIYAQHFTAAGAPLGGELAVAANAASASSRFNPDNPPTIAALHEGGYAIAWAVAANGPAPATIFAQVFAADGTRQGDRFIASKSGVNLDYGSPAAVTLGDGRLLVAGTTYDASLGAFGGADIRAEAFSFPTTQTALTTYGRVLDGIITGATVFADANGNGKLDAGEAKATTDAKGRFTFTTPAGGPVVATGGTDVSTGLAFTGTYTAPAGSLSVTALSTLVQKVMAANGSSVGEAMGRVALALGLSLKTGMTTFNPITATLNGVVDAGKALVADAVVTNTLILAKAGGATGDLYGKLASQIAGASYGTVDVTSSATVQGLGVDSSTALYVSSFAKAGANLLAAKLASGESALTLVHDVTGANSVLQGTAAPDLAAGVAAGSFLGPLVNKYTGDNLAARVSAVSATANKTPFGISYTDVDTEGLGYTNGDAYTGPVAGLQHQYIWPSTHKAAIGASTSNVFLHGGSGDDAISVVGGTNVLDGGAGSNFLVGATGSSVDTFFVDGRGGDVTWSTIVNFHAGDAATIFGFNPGVSTQPFTALDGIGGYQGLTIHSELGGAGTGVNASMTFTGIDQATADAHFTITSGTLGAGTANATGYLYIQYNH